MSMDCLDNLSEYRIACGLEKAIMEFLTSEEMPQRNKEKESEVRFQLSNGDNARAVVKQTSQLIHGPEHEVNGHQVSSLVPVPRVSAGIFLEFPDNQKLLEDTKTLLEELIAYPRQQHNLVLAENAKGLGEAFQSYNTNINSERGKGGQRFADITLHEVALLPLSNILHQYINKMEKVDKYLIGKAEKYQAPDEQILPGTPPVENKNTSKEK